MILITPPQAQLHIAVLGKAGNKPIFTRIAPGAQGVTITGTQGMGVSTPEAAAAATAGLAIAVHKPKGGIFAIGTKSGRVPDLESNIVR